jgi:hypothetical protein
MRWPWFHRLHRTLANDRAYADDSTLANNRTHADDRDDAVADAGDGQIPDRDPTCGRLVE